MKRNERYLAYPVEIIDLIDEKCSAKDLYGLILLRSYRYGYCYMTNQLFADYFSITPRTVVSLLKKLKESNVIRVETIDKHHRKIFPLYGIRSEEDFQEKSSSYSTNVKEEAFPNVREESLPKENSMGKDFPNLREESRANLGKELAHYKQNISMKDNHQLASLADDFEKTFDRRPSREEIDGLADFIDNYNSAFIAYALEQAAEADASFPVKYAKKILIRFKNKGFTTMDEVLDDRWAFQQSHSNGHKKQISRKQLPSWAERPEKVTGKQLPSWAEHPEKVKSKKPSPEKLAKIDQMLAELDRQKKR